MDDVKFEIEYGSTTISLERLNIGKTIAYKAVFSSRRQALIVTKATNFDLGNFWTSIP